MTTKTGSWLMISTLAVAALWAAPAEAITCEEEREACLDYASYETHPYVRETLENQCHDQFSYCISRDVICGDNYCGAGEDWNNCSEDCWNPGVQSQPVEQGR